MPAVHYPLAGGPLSITAATMPDMLDPAGICGFDRGDCTEIVLRGSEDHDHQP
jgi:hypothetical protein